MLKNIMKAGLIAALMVGASNVALAQKEVAAAAGLRPVVADSFVKVNARYGQYFGQYNAGGEDDTAHFKNFGETGIQFSGGVGNARFFVDTEYRSGDQETFEFFDITARASYITPVGLMSIGKVTNYMGQFTLNAGGGIKAGAGGLGAQLVSTFAGAIEDDGIDLLLPLMDKSLFLEFTMWDKAAGKYRTESTARGRANQNSLGSANAFGVMYKTDLFAIKAGVTNETEDDFADPDDEKVTNSYNMFSAQVTLGNMKLTASMSNTLWKRFDKWQLMDAEKQAAMAAMQPTLQANPSEVKFATMGLGFQMKDLGPGTLDVSYESAAVEDTLPDGGSAMANMILEASAFTKMNAESIVVTSLIYSIEISPKIGYQILYNAKTKTPEDSDATTETFIGGGLYGFF